MKLFVKTFWPALILIAVTIVFFYKTIFLGLVPTPGDLVLSEYAPFRHTAYGGYAPGAVPSKGQYFDVARELYPWKHLAIEELKKGHWPLWNPYNFAGTPLLANYQSAVFYPLNILYVLLPFVAAWAILVILQPLLGSLFLYLYAREIGISPWGAIIAALTFNFSSFANVWMEFNTVWHTILWLPLLLWVIERCIREKSVALKHGLVLAISLFSAITAGHPQDFLYTCMFAGIYGIIRIVGERALAQKEKMYIALRLGGASLIAFAIAAPQLLPTVELFKLSSRVPHDPVFVIEKMLIQPAQLIMVFVQDFFGNPATKSYFPADTYVGKTISIGIVGLLFALIALVTRKKKWHEKFYSYSTLVVLILTVRSPIANLLYHYPIPIFSTGSPTRILFLLMLALALLAGFGFDRFKKDAKKIIPVALGVGTILLVALLYTLIAPRFYPLITSIHARTMLRSLIFTGFFAVCGTAILVLFKKHKHMPTLIAVVLVGELLYGFLKFNPFVPAAFVFPENHLLTFLQERHDIARSWGYGTARLEANLTTQYRLFSPDGTDPLNLAHYNAFIQSSQDGNIARTFTRQTRSDANILPGYGETDLQDNTARLRVLDALGVKYILDRVENPRNNETFPGERYTQIYDQDGWKVFFNKKAAGRYFLTHKIFGYQSTEEFEKKFFDPSFDSTNTILVENAPDELTKLTRAKTKNTKLITYEPNRVVIQTESDTTQMLFLSDAYAPGWVARIDRTSAPIYKAQYAFRAVLVPEGTHLVEFSYEPKSFSTGLTIAGTTLSILALYTAFLLIRKKRIR